MDAHGAAKYLTWLHDCYPGETIGLIWDHAAAHKADDVLVHAKEIGIVVAFIPAGLTSILQICDLVLNKPLKLAFKKRYGMFKMRADPGPGGNYKVDRDDVLVWLEEAAEEVSKQQRAAKGIASAFR